MAKAKAKSPSRMIYQGGHSSRKGVLGVLAFPTDFSKEAEYAAFFTTANDQWMQLQFDFDIPSVTYLNDPSRNYKGWWLAGKRGEIVEVVGGKPTITQIETAGTGPGDKLGHLFQIRVIDQRLFICGYGRQVYRLDGQAWTLISEKILDRRSEEPAEWLKSIDGFSKDDVYAAGSSGELWHYDGKKWTQLDSPTNRHLSDVRCIDGKVWTCGKGGIILSGDKNGWEVVWDEDEPVERWWAIESFQGKLYFAGIDFLGTLEDGEIVKVDVGIKDKITTMTLHQKEGILWSIGSRDILAFDGNDWKELVCPPNASP